MSPSTPDHRQAVPGWPDARVAAIAVRQQTMVTRAQLRELGASPGAIERALRRGRLHRVHHGVFSLVAAGARPPLAAEHGALLACGPNAVLSHETAARLHGLPTAGSGTPAEIHLTLVGGDRGRRRPGLRVHRTESLHPSEHHRLHALPVTSVARTALDLAAGLGGPALERLVERALSQTSATKLSELLQRHPGRPGSSAIRQLLDPARPSAEVWSRAEARLLDLIRTTDLPVPEANVLLGRFRPDLLWRPQRVIVEFDSYAHHSSQRAFRADRERHNSLAADGWQIIHITWEQLTERPHQVLVWIAAALARAG
jgi:very-short-patch-repair endonuclease